MARVTSHSHAQWTDWVAGWVFIDRDGALFSYILGYLRDGDALVLPDSRADKQALLQEARYYVLDGLVAKLQDVLASTPPAPACKCIVPIIANEEEDLLFIEATRSVVLPCSSLIYWHVPRHGLPMVKFVYSRRLVTLSCIKLQAHLAWLQQQQVLVHVGVGRCPAAQH